MCKDNWTCVVVGIYVLTAAMEGCRRKLKCLSIPEKVKVIEAVDRKDKIKQEIAKEFDIPVSTLSTILKKKDKILPNSELEIVRVNVREKLNFLVLNKLQWNGWNNVVMKMLEFLVQCYKKKQKSMQKL